MLPIAMASGACSKPTDPAAPTRAYRMGFSAIPPRLNITDVLATIEQWKTRGDAAILLITPPWKSLLADTNASLIIRREHLELVQLYRSRGFTVVVMMDGTDGLNRSAENPELVALGRSIGEPAIQAIYREFAVAIDTILHPDYLGLAMETNLVRAVAPATVYGNLRTMANATATALEARGTSTRLFVSVQVETAWGKLPAAPGYVGIAQDRADFPFAEALGLSSYPNLTTVSEPNDLPLDYYERLVPNGDLPMMVVEGGWASSSIVHPSSPALQARYIERQMALADRAELIAVFQLTFTDLDLESLGPVGAQLGPFATMGLVTKDYADKPALAEWDRGFARPLKVR